MNPTVRSRQLCENRNLSRFYDGKQPSPYMSFAYRAKDEVATAAPAIVHVEGTSPIQTVTAQQPPFAYNVLTALADRGVLPIVANTSMNVAGKPMVDTSQDARTFLNTTPVDVLYLADKRLERRQCTRSVDQGTPRLWEGYGLRCQACGG